MKAVEIEQRQKDLQKLINQFDFETVFIHSDLFRSSLFVTRTANRHTMLESQIKLLESLMEGKNLWFPTFNYQFPKTKVFNANTAICEVGPLPEYYRTHKAIWRSLDPIFSVAGSGPNPFHTPTPEISAFGHNSVFDKIPKKPGILMFYGSTLSSATIIHYIEKLIGNPYRYEKIFPGNIICDDQSYPVKYTYNVRPMGQYFDYDSQKLFLDLQNSGMLHCLKNNLTMIIYIQDIIEFWSDKLTGDPLYFLDQQSRDWVEPMLNKLGRGFLLEDFELVNQ